jgi:hypothetical protein
MTPSEDPYRSWLARQREADVGPPLAVPALPGPSPRRSGSWSLLGVVWVAAALLLAVRLVATLAFLIAR